MKPSNVAQTVSAQRLIQIRKHFSKAAFGSVVLCVTLGALHAFYGDVEQAMGLGFLAGLSYLFVLAIQRLQIIRIRQLGVLQLFLLVTISSITLPLGPVLLSTFLPITLVVISMSKRRRQAVIILLAAILIPVGIWSLGWDASIEPHTPAKQALAVCTLVTSAMAWVVVEAARKRMNTYMETASISFQKIDAQNEVIAAQHEKLVATNLDLEKVTQRLASKASNEKLLTQNLLEKTSDQQNMVHAIHHDLREPLRNIVSFTQLIERKLNTHPAAEKAVEYLAFAKDGGTRMTAMLDDLLRYTKDVEEELVAINLNDLIDELSVDLADTLERNKGQIKSKELPVILGLPTQVRQLFQNLISNALKFSKESESPVILISAEYAGVDVVTIHIADNGIGIPASQLASVFKLFNRANNSVKIAGSGVGLSLCKKICLQHGADLQVTSTINEGSTFSIVGFELVKPAKGDFAAEKTTSHAAS